MDVGDLVGHRLDSNPLTVVDWTPQGWINYEDRRGVNATVGGPDTVTQMEVECGSQFVRGDCNDDGDVNVADVSCALERLFAGGPMPGCLAVLNTNGDGSVDITDPVFLLNFLFVGGPSVVDPFPDCGPGMLPADEQLGCANPPNCQ